jgi:Tol biopolymer transport system component
MSQDDEFDRSLARWFDAEPRPAGTTQVLDRALVATSRRRPRPRLFAPVGSHWVGGGVGPVAGVGTLGRTGVRTSLALLLLLLVLVLAASAVLVAAPRLQSPPGIGHLGHLAYTLDDGLYVADWDGSNARRILSPSELPEIVPEGCRATFGGPTWSPDGRHLAVRTEWNDLCHGFIVVTDAEGSSMTMIPGSGWLISWSPDSRRIVTWIALWETIGIYGIDGKPRAVLPAPRRLMSSGDHDPAWTHDGEAVVVPDGVVVPLDGTAPHVDRRLAHSPARSGASPDGKWIARSEKASIVLSATDGPARRVLDSVASAPVMRVVWSPTGDRIAFRVVGSSPGIVDVATGAVTSLALGLPSGESDVDAFSPDGHSILVSSYGADGRSSLWSVEADGSGAQELVAGSHGGDWQRLPGD